MGNNFQRSQTQPQSVYVDGQQQIRTSGQTGTVNQPVYSSQARSGFFGRSTNKSPNSSYASPVNQHLALRGPTSYTMQNLNSIMTKDVSSKYPQGDGQIYNIKQYNATYQGPFSKGFPSGKGVAHFADGGYYSGDFVEGDANGYGLYIYPNGSVYQGQFSHSQYNGQGTLVYVDKRMKYEGNFSHGLPSGLGRQTYADGSVYEGNFQKGVKNGQGTYQWANGQRYQGSWVDGLMHGKGVLKDSQHLIFQGDFVRGQKSGYGIFRTKEGTYEGNFQNDLLNGNGSFMWSDGKAYEGNFLNSMMHGNGTMYYPSNQVAQGEWENNHNRSLTTVRNDNIASDKLRQIRSRHELGQRSSNTGSQVRNPSISRDNSYGQDSYHYDNSGVVQPSNQTSGVYARQESSTSGIQQQPSGYTSSNAPSRYAQYN